MDCKAEYNRLREEAEKLSHECPKGDYKVQMTPKKTGKQILKSKVEQKFYKRIVDDNYGFDVKRVDVKWNHAFKETHSYCRDKHPMRICLSNTGAIYLNGNYVSSVDFMEISVTNLDGSLTVIKEGLCTLHPEV